jgi:hypothetical protein
MKDLLPSQVHDSLCSTSHTTHLTYHIIRVLCFISEAQKGEPRADESSLGGKRKGKRGPDAGHGTVFESLLG